MMIFFFNLISFSNSLWSVNWFILKGFPLHKCLQTHLLVNSNPQYLLGLVRNNQSWLLYQKKKIKIGIEIWKCPWVGFDSWNIYKPQPLYNNIFRVHSINNRVISKQKCIDYIEKWPFMVIFQYNLYIFWIQLWTVLYPKLCYYEACYKEIVVY